MSVLPTVRGEAVQYLLVDGLSWLWSKIPRFIRKILALAFGVAAVIYCPIGGQLIGRDMVEYNVNGRSQWRSEADARAGQDDWPFYWFLGGLAVGLAILAFCIWYFFSKKVKERGLYD